MKEKLYNALADVLHRWAVSSDREHHPLTDDEAWALEPQVKEIFGVVDDYCVQPHRNKIQFQVPVTTRLDLLMKLAEVCRVTSMDKIEILPVLNDGTYADDGFPAAMLIDVFCVRRS